MPHLHTLSTSNTNTSSLSSMARLGPLSQDVSIGTHRTCKQDKMFLISIVDMANKPEEEHMSVHNEDSASNKGSPNQEGSTRDSIVRSLFPNTDTIVPTIMTTTIIITTPAPVASTDVANTTLHAWGAALTNTIGGSPCPLATYSWATPCRNLTTRNCIS
jgi:hypothetical protein